MFNKTLSPQVPTVIDIQLNNPADTNTYYASAVVKDKVSGATLFSTNLVDKGNKYFSAPWTTPVDSTGNGRELLVITTIYDDAARTSISVAYGATYDTWIIRAATQFFGGGGGGGAFVDYDLIKKLIKEAWNEMPSTDIPETDMKPFESLIQGLSARIDDLAADEDEDEGEEDGTSPVDDVKQMLAEHTEGMSQLLGGHAIKMQQIMGSLFAHHSEVLDDMQNLVGTMGDKLSSSDEERANHLNAITDILDQHKKELLKSVEDSVADFGKQPLEVRMFMPGEIARSKRPPAVEPASKRPLQTLLESTHERSR